jgi:cytochrome d ubiquinol oxidase subunit I
MVLSSLLAYLAVYVGLLLAYIWVVFYLTRKVDDKSISKRSIIPSSASATNAVGAQ